MKWLKHSLMGIILWCLLTAVTSLLMQNWWPGLFDVLKKKTVFSTLRNMVLSSLNSKENVSKLISGGLQLFIYKPWLPSIVSFARYCERDKSNNASGVLASLILSREAIFGCHSFAVWLCRNVHYCQVCFRSGDEPFRVHSLQDGHCLCCYCSFCHCFGKVSLSLSLWNLHLP